MSIRHNNFVKFSEERMTRIFQIMNLIANLSMTTRYTYTKNEVEELFRDYFEKGELIKSLFYIKENNYTPLEEDLTFSFLSVPINNDSKNKKFRKLIIQRINNIYKNLQLISNLRNKKNYTYSTEEVDALFSAYIEKGQEIKRHFEPNIEPLTEEFSYSDYF